MATTHKTHPGPKTQNHKALAEKPGRTEFKVYSDHGNPSNATKHGGRTTPARTYNVINTAKKK